MMNPLTHLAREDKERAVTEDIMACHVEEDM